MPEQIPPYPTIHNIEFTDEELRDIGARLVALARAVDKPAEVTNIPGAFTAYRRTDGELIYGEFSWIADHYECGHGHGDDPDEIEEVVMVPLRVRKFMCHVNEPNEEDE